MATHSIPDIMRSYCSDQGMWLSFRASANCSWFFSVAAMMSIAHSVNDVVLVGIREPSWTFIKYVAPPPLGQRRMSEPGVSGNSRIRAKPKEEILPIAAPRVGPQRMTHPTCLSADPVPTYDQ